ncbi:MAG: hypothetical protein ABSA90_19215 [Xanthobacteraceae bacterium]|jgi:hypothetical protein
MLAESSTRKLCTLVWSSRCFLRSLGSNLEDGLTVFSNHLATSTLLTVAHVFAVTADTVS